MFYFPQTVGPQFLLLGCCCKIKTGSDADVVRHKCFYIQAYNSETKDFEEPPLEARNAALKGKVSGSLAVIKK